MLALATFPTPAAVGEALSLRRGAHVWHGVDVLDGQDQLTSQRLRFEYADVTWDYRAADRVVGQSAEVAEVRRRGSIRIPAGQALNLNAVRLRLWSEFRLLDGRWQRFPRGVFVIVNPGALQHDGVRVVQDMTLADKSYRWANTFLAAPLGVPAGTVIVDWVRARLTARFGETRFAIPTSTATLATAQTFETGLSELEVCSRLLEAAAMDQLSADEIGQPATRSLAELAGKGPETVYGAGQGKVLAAGQVEPLLPTLPNVVTFSARQGPSLGNSVGNGLVVRRNQQTGPASIDARGGTGVGEVELQVSVDVENQAALEQVANADAQRYMAGGGLRWSGKVGLNPLHNDRDVIGLQLPELGLTTADGWNVTSWSYPMRPVTSTDAVLMDVTAERRVQLT